MRGRSLPRRVLVLTLTIALVPQTAGAAPLTTGPLVQVSGASPIAGCTADDVAGQFGSVSLNSEVEPWVEVDPTNSAHIVGTWQQDRWSNGGARGNVVGVSNNGGATWTIVSGTKSSVCTGGDPDFPRASDPWVTFAPDGDVYLMTLAAGEPPTPTALPDRDAMIVSKSTDGGLTWGPAIELIRDERPTVFNDKNSMTADPFDSNFVYAVWDRLVFSSVQASRQASEHALGFRGPIWFSRTTNGGASWEPARMIFDPGQINQTISNQIVVAPDGTLFNFFELIFNFRNDRGVRGINLAFITSDDRGATWSSGATIIAKHFLARVRDPETGGPVRTGDIVPDVAVDPSSGALYVAWQDRRFNGVASIAFSQSLDGGATWSAPIKVNQTPTGIPLGNQQAFTPSVAVRSDGTIAVTYYDFRSNTIDGATLPTDYFSVHCQASCADPASWIGNETQLTDASFDMQDAPATTRGPFTGDYVGLASDGADFLPFFSQPHPGDPASIFIRRAG